MHVATLFEAVCDHNPDTTAIVYGEKRFSYAEFDHRAARLAGHLMSRGVGRGAPIGIMLHNCNEYLEAVFAAFKLRGTPVNINYRYKLDELAYVLDNASARALVLEEELADLAKPALELVDSLEAVLVVGKNCGHFGDGVVQYEAALTAAEPAPRIERSSDDLYLIYTGGTTGYPKGVAYKNGDYLRQITAVMNQYGINGPERPDQVPVFLDAITAAGAVPVVLPASPMMHQTGMSFGGLMPLSTGGTSVLLEPRKFSARALFEAAQRHRVTAVALVGDAFGVPIMEELEHAHGAGTPWLLPSLRMIVSSGAMWSYKVRAGILKHLAVTLVDNIASTEGNMGLAISRRGKIAPTGVFTPAANVAVVGDNLQSLPPGSDQVGRIAIRASLPLGYHADAEKSAEVFVNVGDVRLTLPGDSGQVLEDGDILLLGRGSNCINTGGEKVFPEEVEEALKSHPDIVDALVVGLPDERFGEQVAAVVQGGAVSQEDLIEYVKNRIAGYKVPRIIRHVSQVARFPSGKPDYSWARAALESTEWV